MERRGGEKGGEGGRHGECDGAAEADGETGEVLAVKRWKEKREAQGDGGGGRRKTSLAGRVCGGDMQICLAGALLPTLQRGHAAVTHGLRDGGSRSFEQNSSQQSRRFATTMRTRR